MLQLGGMDNRDLYSIIAGILPPLLGLGLIELYMERDVGVDFVVAGIVALALLMIVIAALVDIKQAAEHRPRRRRRRH
jgi:hypothetical protein